MTDGSTISLKAVDMFENLKPTVKHLQIAISQQIVDETISQIVSKIIKQQGYKSFVMFGYSDFYSKFISALKTKKIYKKGVGVIINGFGILGKQEDGLLYVIDDELVTAKTWSEYEALGILFYTDKIVEFITQSNTLDGRTSNLNSMIIKEIFEEMTKSHRKKPFFSIINQANSTRNLIGKINNNQISLSYSNIIFPGNSTDIPDNSIAEIILSIAAGSTEPNGATLNLYNSNNYLGSLYAE